MECVRTYAGQLDTPSAIKKLQELRQTLVSDLVMTRIPVATEKDAFHIFETLNARGLKLQAPDLLLNFLMREAPENDRDEIREYWTEIVQRMERFDINNFLRHVWVSKYGDLKDRDLFTALTERIEEEKTESKKFARVCADECESYVQLLKAEEDYIDKETLPFLRSLLRELNVQASLPLLLSAYTLLNKKDFRDVVKWLLVFYTRYSIIANRDLGDMEDLLFSLARRVRVMVTDPNDSIASKSCAKEIKFTLDKYTPTTEEIKSKVPELIFDDNGSDAKYVMKHLAEHIQSQTKEIGMKETNLEHIYPQNPKPNEWGGEANQAKLNPFLWHIGNLTIYGTRVNREASKQRI